MPHISDEDGNLISSIEHWKATARDEVDDIGGWRDADVRRREQGCWSRPRGDTVLGGTMPNMFYTHTACLVGAIISRYPKLDPEPLQKVYAAIAAWHEDHNATRIPPQSALFSALEQAMLVLNAVEIDIRSRVTPSADSTLKRLLQLIRGAMPEPVELADDDYLMLKAYVETTPVKPVTWSRVQQEKRTGQTAYHDELRADKEWRAHLKMVLEYNSLKRQAPDSCPTALPTGTQAGGEPDGRQLSATGSKRRAGKRRRTAAVKPLTDLQRQALELYGKHNGKLADVAREMGVTHPTAHKHLKAAWRKLPDLAPTKSGQSGRTQRLSTNRRGQVDL